MPGLPKHIMRMKGLTMKQKWALHRKKGGKAKSKSRSGGRTRGNPRSAPKPKKFTEGKANDLFSIAAPAIHKAAIYAETGDINALKSIPGFYTGFDLQTNTFNFGDLWRGYGGAGIHAIEKKIFKAAGVRGPRTQMKTLSDALDHITYYGMAAIDVYNNRSSPREAIRLAHLDLNGVDLALGGSQAIQPMKMLTTKTIPYILQKKALKFLRNNGITFGM